MKRTIAGILLLAASVVLFVSCGGGSGSSTKQPNWDFVLDKSAATPHGTRAPVLIDLGTLKPGQTITPVDILAVSKNGFSGSVSLSDVASDSPDHIVAQTSLSTIVPTPSGAPFSVGFTVPANYPYSGSGVTFQGKDDQRGTRQKEIAFKVATLSPTFDTVTFAPSTLSGSGSLSLKPLNGFTGQVSITFDTDLTRAPTGFSPLPNTVQVTAPNSPVTISGTSAVSTPINFAWTSWPIGNYEVIAVLKNGNMAIRTPLQIKIATPNPSTLAVTQWHNDGMRTGLYPYETLLTQGNVGSSTFGKLFSQSVSSPIENQPLYVPNVDVAGKGTHNVVYVAATNDTVYAFDADNMLGSNATPLWQATLGTPIPPGALVAGNEDNDGILSTPVIDLNSKTIYVSAMDFAGGIGVSRLHALDLGSGAEKMGGPITVTGTVSGTLGANGNVNFDPMNSYQRPGLMLLNGVVYTCYGGLFGDPAPDRGWIFGYNASNLQQQTCVFTTAPDVAVGDPTGYAGGAIWMGGAAPSTDGTYLYVATGNGDFDANSGGADYGDSILKLQPSGNTLKVADYFTPHNQKALADADLDLGSSNPMLIPNGGSNLLLQLTKTSTLYLVNASSMGKFNSTSDQIVQEISDGSAHVCLSAPAYYNGSVYYARIGDNLVGRSVGGGMLAGAAFARTTATFNRTTPSISYNGAAASPANSAIVWAIENSGGNAVLHAYAASNLNELYSSNNGADTAGPYIKWGVPTVAAGKVYVPCGNQLAVYGLRTPGAAAKVVPKKKRR
ncbi:MAG TPA: hypothetical protein VG944_12730 [Fimbriimonas sp.]|nr:hypothetical protein [Fimbriimonas sp.]